MQKLRVTNGVYWVEIPEADLYILCGCPADSVKHLMKRGLIYDTKKNGVSAQTGPNAILLSDTTIQRGSFSNLGEFPVLQMLYLQGMIIPQHPNNTGRKPMLIGLADQVKSQGSYIYRGNYGLTSLDEILETGMDPERARDILRIKRWFAYGNIRKTEDLLDMRVVDAPAVELRRGAFVRRRGFNKYQFIHGGQSVSVDLNLADSEEYPPPWSLRPHRIRRERFSVVHMGEGDGWDVTRPCMGSIVCFAGRIYLVDAGPDIQYSLAALGISANEIAGIFHTHSHDDHFAGLTSLVNSDRRIQYYATAPVRASVVKKYAALTGRSESSFAKFFDAHDLDFDRWNPVEGLEVMPVFSAHPVETNVFFFRSQGKDGYRTYAHLADLSSFDVLRKMIADDPSRNGISQSFYDSCTRTFLQPADVKKVDAGEGQIHGHAGDFAKDRSGRIFISHTSAPLSRDQKKVGVCASFGQQDILIPAGRGPRGDLRRAIAAYLPHTTAEDAERLAGCAVLSCAPGRFLLKPGARVKDVLLLLGGTVEFSDAKGGLHTTLSAGAVLAEPDCLLDEACRGTYRAAGFASLLRIPLALYREVLERGGCMEDQRRCCRDRRFLQETWLFGETVSFPLQHEIARRIERRTIREGEVICPAGTAELVMLVEGLVTVFVGYRPIENLTPGGFFGEETLLAGMRDVSGAGPEPDAAGACASAPLFQARALLDSTLAVIPGEVLADIPIVQSKLIETYERRLKSFGAEIRFGWLDSYALGVPEIDEQHKELFQAIERLSAVAYGLLPAEGIPEAVEKFTACARAHLSGEETRIGPRAPKEYDTDIRVHEELLRKLEGLQKYLGRAPADALRTMIDFMEDWALDHVLLENVRYRNLLKG